MFFMSAFFKAQEGRLLELDCFLNDMPYDKCCIFCWSVFPEAFWNLVSLKQTAVNACQARTVEKKELLDRTEEHPTSASTVSRVVCEQLIHPFNVQPVKKILSADTETGFHFSQVL